jgi:hypothetical protein
LLRAHLASLKNEAGHRRCQVTARNRVSDAGADDPVLSTLDRSEFDELWLFAIDSGDGLTAADCQGIMGFRQRAGGILWSIEARWCPSRTSFWRAVRRGHKRGINLHRLSGTCFE